MIDVNGDGRADIIAVSDNGQIVVWENILAAPPNGFHYGVQWWRGDPANHHDDRMFAADVTGRRRADIIAVSDNGQIVVWENTTAAPPDGFHYGVTWWGGDGAANYHDYRTFAADVTGRRRADIIAVSDNGRIVVWENTCAAPPDGFHYGVTWWGVTERPTTTTIGHLPPMSQAAAAPTSSR